MSRNNNYQSIQELATSIPSSTQDFLRSQQKDIVCTDCGGISAAKVQQLLSTLEGTTQLFHSTPSKTIPRKKNSRLISAHKKKPTARNNSQKTSSRRNMKKTKPKIRSSLSSRNNNNRIRSKPKNNKIKKLASKKK